LSDLQAYDVASQTPEQRLSTRVLAWYIGNQLDGEKFRLHNYPVNQLFGVQNGTPDFLINQHRIDDVRGAKAALAKTRSGSRSRHDQSLLNLYGGRVARSIVVGYLSLSQATSPGAFPPLRQDGCLS